MLQVRMLGSLSFEADQQLIRPELGHSGSLLACYLLQFPDRLHRCARLVDLFWPDLAPDKARSAFNTAKWRLRKLLSEHSESEFVLRIADDLMFKGSPSVVVDTHTLDRAAKSIPCHASTESLTQEDEDRIANAVLAYSGPFLEGEDGEWILQERKRLQASLLKAAVHLMRVNVARRNYDAALDFAQRIAGVDPLNERSHVDLMLLLLLIGRQAEALQNYQQLASLLRSELGINPMPETVQLANQIKSGEIFSHLEDLLHRLFTAPVASSNRLAGVRG